MRFADDIAILADNTTVLQEAVSSLLIISKRMGLKINGDKTEVQFLGKGGKQFDIQVDGHSLKQTEKFLYLGGTISSLRNRL